MKHILFHITFCISLLVAGEASAQVNCTVPLPPVLTSVSVRPETSQTEFTWLPSESTDIAAYIVYSFSDGDGQAIDTIWNPAATSDMITNTAPKYSSVSYVVAAHRLSVVAGMPGCTSKLSNVLTTIFCQVSMDTCYRKLIVKWNSYPSVPRAVISYSIMMSVNGGAYSEQVITDTGALTYTYDNFITDDEYCFYVKANLEGGYNSASNKVCVQTEMPRPPDWINADFATVTQDNKIALSFTVDPASGITRFLLEKKAGTSEPFEQVAFINSADGAVAYTDGNADAGIVNFYRLSAINSCNNPVTISNLASNIMLDLKLDGNLLKLLWNPYRDWLGTIGEYRIFINTGDSYYEKTSIPSSDTTWSAAYKDIMYDITGKQVCFYVVADETSNPHSVNGQSTSQEVCLEPREVITVPNIFTPNNDLKNDLFRPVLSFTAVSYHLVISDQHGTVLFETRDQSETWDGKTVGKPQPDGICLWFLKVTTPSGRNLTKSGTVTLLRNN